MPKKQYKSLLLKIDDLEIPVRIYKEPRISIRASLTKNYASLRLPKLLPPGVEKVQLNKFYSWLKEEVLVKEKYRSQFLVRKYFDGYSFTLYDQSYTISINKGDNKNHSARYLGNGKIMVKLSKFQEGSLEPMEISRLLSRIIAKMYKPIIEARIHNLNDQYFQKDIQSVRLKYNRSNWGSCSSSGNINISTRLLFAPKKVQDYVLVHELAHMIEMNHSKKFWDIIRNILPNYKEHEQWLKTNGHLCDFGL